MVFLELLGGNNEEQAWHRQAAASRKVLFRFAFHNVKATCYADHAPRIAQFFLVPLMTPAEHIASQADRIRSSQVLGRSRLINRLFDFLVECSVTGRVPKEIEVAIDAFDRDQRFDPSQDAVVRVCVHKLRRKLEEFYSGPGAREPARLSLARGEYRLLVETVAVADLAEAGPDPDPVAEPLLTRHRKSLPKVLGFALAFSITANLLLWITGTDAVPSSEVQLNEVRRSALWAPLLDDDLPIYLVVGDYYVFGEVDEFLDVKRLVRDFEINSREDLEWEIQRNPGEANRYQDLNLDYVPTASAFALREIMPVLAAANRRVRLTVVSELDPALFKSAHIIYVGYLSGLGMLREIAFAGSRFTTGETYDELIDHTSGVQYVSEVGGPVQGQLRYRDYGYFSTFSGPAGNHVIIVAGTRDTAVMQTAEMITNQARIDELGKASRSATAVEALYEVYGFENTNIDAKLLLAASLDTSGIWAATR